MHPTFTKQEIINLDTKVEYSHALNNTDYLPGVIGMNNLNNTDWLNVIIQSLMRVCPLRNYFIEENNYIEYNSVLVKRFGEFVRKYFNGRNFKGQVSPHELLQAISHESKKKFQIGKKSDSLAFLSWFLNKLHKELNGNKKHNSSIISETFQGQVIVHKYEPIKNLTKQFKDEISKDKNLSKNIVQIPQYSDSDDEYYLCVEKIPFFFVLLNLPEMPLFKDSQQEKFIPQIPISELLDKFNGNRVEYLAKGVIKTYKFGRLPKYLIIAYKRFVENNFFVEKNSTIVNFGLKNLDLKDYLFPIDADKNELGKLSTKQLRAKLIKYGAKHSKSKSKSKSKTNANEVNKIKEKSELINQIVAKFPDKSRWKTKYDLVANICHKGDYHNGVFSALTYHQANNVWYEMEDLHVKETMPQLVVVSEAYIQLWKRK